MKKKTVLLVFGGNLERGGVQSFLLNWIKYAPQNRYSFTWYLNGIMKDSDLAEEFCNLGVRLVYGNVPLNSPLLYRAWKMTKDIVNLFNRNRFDIVHVNTASLGVNVLSLGISKIYRVPQRISHSHNAPQGNVPFKFLISILRKIILYSATDFVGCSEKAAEYLYGGNACEKAKIIYNCIDTKQFQFSKKLRDNMREKLGLTGCFVIGHVGTFSARKNQKFLIEIFRYISQIKDDARLLLVGNGDLESKIREKVAEYGVEDKIIFAGLTNRVQDYMCAMDVFVLPSIFEGFPIVGVEAQANGLPCIFSGSITREINITGAEEFVSLTETAEEWARKILAHNGHFDGGERSCAYEYIRNKKFDIDSISNNVINLYQ